MDWLTLVENKGYKEDNKVFKYGNRLPREVREFPFLKIFKKKGGHNTKGHGLVGQCSQLDFLISKIFSNLNDSMILGDSVFSDKMMLLWSFVK